MNVEPVMGNVKLKFGDFVLDAGTLNLDSRAYDLEP